MKKVLIASILATLMLTVPLNSVVGTSNVEEDCNCKPIISDLQVVRIERLLDRLASRINFILLRYGHIPEVAEKCEEVLELINSNDFKELLCNALESLAYILTLIGEIIPIEIWWVTFGLIWLALMGILIVYCDWMVP